VGVSHSGAELAGKLGRLAGDFGDMPKVLVKESSLLTKQTIKGFAPARLRGAGRRGANLDVSYNVVGSGEEAASLVFARGPWQLIERDTAAHQIPRQRGPRARARYAVFGNNVFSRVSHPGTRGKHPWEHGVNAAVPLVNELFRTKGALAIRRIF